MPTKETFLNDCFNWPGGVRHWNDEDCVQTKLKVLHYNICDNVRMEPWGGEGGELMAEGESAGFWRSINTAEEEENKIKLKKDCNNYYAKRSNWTKMSKI